MILEGYDHRRSMAKVRIMLSCEGTPPPPVANSHPLQSPTPPGRPSLPCLQGGGGISYALAQATVGVGTVINVYVNLITYEM